MDLWISTTDKNQIATKMVYLLKTSLNILTTKVTTARGNIFLSCSFPGSSQKNLRTVGSKRERRGPSKKIIKIRCVRLLDRHSLTYQIRTGPFIVVKVCATSLFTIASLLVQGLAPELWGRFVCCYGRRPPGGSHSLSRACVTEVLLLCILKMAVRFIFLHLLQHDSKL